MRIVTLRKGTILYQVRKDEPKHEIVLLYKDTGALTILLAHMDIFTYESKLFILHKLCEN